ncbi:hypothetical protein DPEC_G00256240 [Dallia pectoralis]|uniref:Uncharacterized protein n=1 Tax=Dallia pectoralis TaxID=75939 RepID=A0ACC2FUR2_DALPE|nr:hypothetical protein DPEC_G00256240 [Dallia pectoralis]
MQRRHCPLLHPLNRQIPDRLLHPGVHLKLLEVGGRESKIDIPIAVGWLFSNSLMARFNMKGKGTKGKTALEKTKVYIAIQDGVMTCDAADT